MVTITKPILDFITARGSENRVIDLNTVFSGEGLTYTVSGSDPSVAAVTVEGSQLTIDFLETLGYSDLKITATDSSGTSVTDNVRVRVAGENAYTIAVLPDTQDYTNAWAIDTFKGMTQWLVDNKDSLNIQFVNHVGDVTGSNTVAEWEYAAQALGILNGKIPYSVLPGNHDQASGGSASDYTSNLDLYFSPEQQAANNPDTFGGVYDQEPDSARNSYQTFTAPDGTKWLVLNLEFGAREDVVRWAGEVIEDNLDARVIINTHSYMTWAGRHDATGSPLYDEGTGYNYGLGNSAEGASDGEAMYRALVQKYPNVTFTFSGHIFGDGAETLVSYDQFGNPVYQMMVNYQYGVADETTGNGDPANGNTGGHGAIRLITIDPDNGAMYTTTYFSELDEYVVPGRGEELDRDDLTGPYRGHEETYTGIDLGTPEVPAIAKAGNDQFVSAAAGQDKASVTLDGDWTLNPNNDAGLTYVWTDRDGNEIATGATPTLALGAGDHVLTLTVTDSAGNVSRDDVRIVVSNAGTLLVENFNDGNLDGWSAPGSVEVNQGTTEEFGIAALGEGASVTQLPGFDLAQGLRVQPTQLPPGQTSLDSYTLVFDLLIPEETASGFTSLFQTDTANASDAEFFLRNNSDGTAGLGISGVYEGAMSYDEWHRVAITVDKTDAGYVLSKYVDGVKVGVQTIDDSRFSIDLSKGVLLFSDNDREVSPLYVSSFLVTDKVYTDDEISALGGAKAGGIVDTAPSPFSTQIDFGASGMPDTFGHSTASAGALGGGVGSYMVKGTANSRDTAEDGQAGLEGRAYERSNNANNVLFWNADEAKSWSDYTVEATLKVNDGDDIGLVFYYQDDKNYYRVVLESQSNSRSVVKVEDGVATVLATEHGGTPWNRDFQLKVTVSDGEIRAFLDGEDMFGAVVDTAPFTGGTIGLYSSNENSQNQMGAQFDNISVNKVALTAHAGSDVRLLDSDGDGLVAVDLDAGSSYGNADIVSYVWKDADGTVVAEGKTASATVGTGRNVLTLTVTDAAGKTSTDTVTVDAVAKDRVLLSDAFGGTDFSDWTIVDEGEFGGVGADGTSSQWELRNGALVQLSDLKSRQLEWNGASNTDPWDKGWSPLGDGVNVLRKGTYALYNDPDAKGWSDYAVETTISTPDNGAVGVLFYYQDENNYYKLELDANGDYDWNPYNGAGSLFQLIQVKDGVEKYLTQIPAKYTPGEAFDLRVEVKDNKIQASVDGMELFAYAIEDHAQTKGTVGLFAWDSAGVSFDNVSVVSLADDAGPQPGDNTAPLASDDTGFTAQAGQMLVLSAALLLANDTDADGDTLSILSVGNAVGGTATLDAAGNVLFTPTAGFNGAASFTYTVSDGEGGHDTAKVEIAVGAPVNHVPEATDDRLYVLQGKPVDIAAGSLLANDRDTDGDTLTLVSVQDATHGSVQLVNGKAVFTPAAGFTGEASFTYTVSDGKGGQDTASVTVVVRPQPNRAPVAANDSFEVNAGAAASLATALLLANDTDADANPLSVVSVQSGTGGTVKLQGDHVVFTPADGFTGEAKFTYTVSDGKGGTSSATVTVNVKEVDPYEGWTRGTAGDDELRGNAVAANKIYGDAGHDVIYGGMAADELDGGAGNDVLRGHQGNDTLAGGAGDDLLEGGAGNDRLRGGEGDDVLQGGQGDDILGGAAGDDVLYGGGGNDTLYGGVGDDQLDGGQGDDRLIGFTGDDVMTGGAGHDTFVFAANSGADIIVDFRPGEDTIEFDGLDFETFDDVVAAMVNTAAGVAIQLDDSGDNYVVLEGIVRTHLSADDFTFV
ncbi:Uncharacterised protein [Starkeya nomas]|uniref:PKD domain-containing protein n=1 Tax=Starkeya nomas TaxID=2666134 RepID=A0A5S9P9P8_9HYPH|nr:cadherin-like domain-containing protein [Starkeya nomas]CAA0100461.1 Uncharacterised protein [Starkeya nomas]